MSWLKQTEGSQKPLQHWIIFSRYQYIHGYITTMENSMIFFRRSKFKLPYDLSIWLLGIYTKWWEAVSLETYKNLMTPLFTIVRKQNKQNTLSTKEWLRQKGDQFGSCWLLEKRASFPVWVTGVLQKLKGGNGGTA